jgi:hypothetical protein
MAASPEYDGMVIDDEDPRHNWFPLVLAATQREGFIPA